MLWDGFNRPDPATSGSVGTAAHGPCLVYRSNPSPLASGLEVVAALVEVLKPCPKVVFRGLGKVDGQGFAFERGNALLSTEQDTHATPATAKKSAAVRRMRLAFA